MSKRLSQPSPQPLVGHDPTICDDSIAAVKPVAWTPLRG